MYSDIYKQRHSYQSATSNLTIEHIKIANVSIDNEFFKVLSNSHILIYVFCVVDKVLIIAIVSIKE